MLTEADFMLWHTVVPGMLLHGPQPQHPLWVQTSNRRQIAREEAARHPRAGGEHLTS